MSDVLSARAAAEVCGVDERTIRRWVKSGQLAADKRGGRFLIDRSVLEPFIGHSDGHTNGHDRTDAAERTDRTADAVSLNLELVRLVDRLQRENLELAGRIGWLEAQVEHYKALPSPTTSETAPQRTPDDDGTETTQRSSEPRNGRPWWRFWQPSQA